MTNNSTPERHTGRVTTRGRCLSAWIALCCCLAVFCFYQAAPSSTAPSAAGPTLASWAPTDRVHDRPAPTDTKKIEDLRPGDLVVSRNEKTGEITRKEVLQAFEREADHLRIVRVRSAAGIVDEIRTTDEHPFWVQGDGFVKARELKTGAKLLDYRGEVARVLDTEYEAHPEGVKVYNFTVDEFHTYFVAARGSRAPPIFVHNADCYIVDGVLVKTDNYDALLRGDVVPDPVQVVDAGLPQAPTNVVDKSWKLKIQGTAQKTGTPGHQFRTYREAIAEAKNPNVRSVHLDHGYNRGLDLDPKTIQPNRRPDVLSVYDNNSVLRVEVQSRTDIPAVLGSRNAALDAQLRAQGFTPTPPRVVRPTTTP